MRLVLFWFFQLLGGAFLMVTVLASGALWFDPDVLPGIAVLYIVEGAVGTYTCVLLATNQVK